MATINRRSCDICKKEFIPIMEGFKSITEIYAYEDTEYGGPGPSEDVYTSYDVCHTCAIRVAQRFINSAPREEQKGRLLRNA